MPRKVSDQEFLEAWRRLGSPSFVAEALGLTERQVYARRKALQAHVGDDLSSFNAQSQAGKARAARMVIKRHEGVVDLEIEDGTVIVFSDAHYFPGVVTTAHKALLSLIRKLKPAAVICNGDAFDGATISRHPRIGWQKSPSPMEELKAVRERLGEVEAAAGRARLVWPLGNHCMRFDTYLSANASQMEGMPGFRLADHFPAWQMCWMTRVNESTVIKHRHRGGIHATYNNTLHGGVSIVTGHLHQLKVTPFSDYNGRRYGVDSGTLADPYGPQFADYTEMGPVNWHSGFVVLTFRRGSLLSPELVERFDDGVVQFRGELLDAETGEPCL